MSKILIGTSGFSYDDWKGEFYPKGTDSKDFLEYYSRHFKALELNFSYYRIPNARQSKQMIAKSGGEVQFVVKAFRQMTHDISEKSLIEVIPLFIKGISPFKEVGRLGAILLQFPQSFHYISENRLYLKSLIEAKLRIEDKRTDYRRGAISPLAQNLGQGHIGLG